MRRSTLLLVVLGVLVVTVVWFIFFINPKRSEISDSDDQIATAQTEAQALRGQKAALLAIQESELTFRRAAAELERSIPRTPELAQFIEDVNLLAIEAGVEISSLTPSLPEATEGLPFVSVPVSIAVEGQFFEILGFLYGLADLDRLVRIDALSITSSFDEDGNLSVSSSISAQIFTLETNLPTPLAPAPEGGEAPAEEGEEAPAEESGEVAPTDAGGEETP